MGGIIATYAFLAKDAPRYVPGYAICVAFVGVSIISCSIYYYGCWSANKKRASLGGGGEFQKAELGDLRRDYRYML